MRQKTLILASSSPRRRDFIKKMGLSARSVAPQVDERRRAGETPVQMAMRLSLDKAKAAVSRAHAKTSVILAADTIVISPTGAVLGKPRSRAEAVRMLKALQGRVHEVITAYCLLEAREGRVRRKVCKKVRTRVKIRAMNSREITSYLARGESMDKAGAYAAQGFGALNIEWVRGSYSNVIGLPVSDVIRDLRNEFGIHA